MEIIFVTIVVSKSKGASDLCLFGLNGVSHKVLQGQPVCIKLFCLSPACLCVKGVAKSGGTLNLHCSLL